MKAKQLIKSLEYFAAESPIMDFDVKGIGCNSKQVRNGFIFVAVKGAKQDGNIFINEAINRGAKAIVLESLKAQKLIAYRKINFIRVKDVRKALAQLATQFYGYPSKKVKVVGITGTNGKTTITYLLEALLKQIRISSGVIGTINYRFKDKIIAAKNTTPGPVELQSMLARMQRQKVRYCLMEVSSHALEQERVEGIGFHSAIFTNLTQDHLDYHKTKERYFQSKAKLFKNLDKKGFAAINIDDRYGKRIKRITKAKVITYGIDNRAHVMAKDIIPGSLHTEFLLISPDHRMYLKTRLIGRHNIYNILAAAAWAIEEGLPLLDLKHAIENFSLVPGRLERVNTDKGFSIFVDYAHTEDALKNILISLRHLNRKRIIVVFGCGGDRDRAKRSKMGKVVSRLADYAIITNDNPRSENPHSIINQIKKGMINNNFCIIPDRKAAIRKSLSMAKEGDIVLIAGKGHEDYQIFGNKILHFDDREVARKCLKSLN